MVAGGWRQQFPANFRKFQISFTSDDMVGELNDGLVFGFVTDFRATQNDFNIRPKTFDGGDDFRRRGDIPNINAEADDFWLAGQQHFRDVERPLVDVKLDEGGTGPQITEISQQITQPERGMDVFRVEGG